VRLRLRTIGTGGQQGLTSEARILLQCPTSSFHLPPPL
jgi:hypothetical protein